MTRSDCLRRDAATAVVCAAVCAAVAGALVAGGWVQGLAAPLVASLTGVAMGVLLARLTLTRSLAAPVAITHGLFMVVLLTIGTMPADGESGVLHVVRRYAEAIAGGLLGSDDWPFTVGLLAVLWANGLWLAWMTMRERQGVLAILPCYTVLGINALNAPSPGHTLPLEIAAAALCLVVLADAQLGTLLGLRRNSRVPALPGVAARFGRSTLLASTGIVLLALVLPPVSTRDLSAFLFSSHIHLPGDKQESRIPPGKTASAPPTVRFSPATIPAGPLQNSPQPVLTYTSDSKGPAYLRMVNDTIFEAGNWYPADDRGLNTSVSVRDGRVPRDDDPAHGAVGTSETTVNALVTYLSTSRIDIPYAPFPGEPEAYNVSKTFGVDDVMRASGLASASPDLLVTIDDVVPQASPALAPMGRSSALVPTATEDQLRRAGTHYPPFAQSLSTMPVDGSGQMAVIHSLALRWTAGTSNAYDAAKAIEGRLRDPQAFSYTLFPPSAPAGVWPVVYFLTSSHRGYCQYFASSMGAMLRSLGIPTRLVNGYGPGSLASTPTGLGSYLVTTSDAHTWVEAYFPSYGWVPFEPTPPSAEGAYQPFSRTGTPAPTPRATVGSTPTPSPTPLPSASPSPPPAPTKTSNHASTPGNGVLTAARMVGLPALLVALLFIALVSWWLWPPTLTALWRRLALLGRMAGRKRMAWDTHHSYLSRLTETVSPPLTSDALRAPLMEIA
ncbi:MAG TPA: transglutaminase-like domain-containing protein, partial [Candidatus Sulfotelmatobacter sp.]|nr:transglutaminase-like domain-containing protein [Candidatus Sulfotelmatobacter sp.]